MNIEDRVQHASRAVVYDLVNHGVPVESARDYADKHVQPMVETGMYTEDCISDLKGLLKNGERAWVDIKELIKPFVLSFAERARLEIERNETHMSIEDAEKLKQDLIAMEELEAICCDDKQCPVTTEEREMMQILTEGFDPDKFDKVKPEVTKEEVEQFRVLGKKFGLSQQVIAQGIEFATRGTPSQYAQRLVSRQELIDERRRKHMRAIDHELRHGPFGRDGAAR